MRNPRIEELFAGLARSAGAHALIQRLSDTTRAHGQPLRLSGLTLTAKAEDEVALTGTVAGAEQLPLGGAPLQLTEAVPPIP